MVIAQYEVYLINLDPTIEYEIKKSRPCVIISLTHLYRIGYHSF